MNLPIAATPPIGKDCQNYYFARNDRRFTSPTRNVNHTIEQDAFVEEIVWAGKYQNASEAVRDALRGLQFRHQQDELKLAALRTHVEAGVAALARGAFTEVEDANLDAWLDDLAATGAG